MEYREKTYRHYISKEGLHHFEVRVQETDLLIGADTDLTDQAYLSVQRHRHFLETYIRKYPLFQTSLRPVALDDLAPPIVKAMLAAAKGADVGPMASVAGAMAEFVAADLLTDSLNIIIENGGDLYLAADREVRVGIFAGESPLSGKVALRIKPDMMPLGVCTSSATVGPSLSLGGADAVCVTARSAALADAAATSIGNVVRNAKDIRLGLVRGQAIFGVLGTVIIVGDKLGAWGNVELV